MYLQELKKEQSRLVELIQTYVFDHNHKAIQSLIRELEEVEFEIEKEIDKIDCYIADNPVPKKL